MKLQNIAPLSKGQMTTAREQFERDGFYLVPSVIPQDLLERVRERIGTVYAGEYETGIPPAGNTKLSKEPPKSLVKIDNAHRSDKTLASTHNAHGYHAFPPTAAFLRVNWRCSTDSKNASMRFFNWASA